MGITIQKDRMTGELRVSDGKNEIAVPLADLDAVIADAKTVAEPTLGELRVALAGAAEHSDDPSAISSAAASLVTALARREAEERRRDQEVRAAVARTPG